MAFGHWDAPPAGGTPLTSTLATAMVSLFGWFSRRSKQQQMVDLFSEHVSPEVLEAIASQPPSLNRLSEGPVEFILAYVQGASPNETGELIGAVATTARDAGWMVQDIVCNLVVIVRGSFPFKEPPTMARRALVDGLLQSVGARVKVVHGSEVASFGNMGSAVRMTYGLLFPSFSNAMATLISLPFGQCQEFRRG